MRILIITCLIIGSVGDLQGLKMDCSHPSYTINGKVVRKGKFEKFLQNLTAIPGTWYCAEMDNGGMTVYEAKDKQGVIFKYEAETSSLKCIYKLTRK